MEMRPATSKPMRAKQTTDIIKLLNSKRAFKVKVAFHEAGHAVISTVLGILGDDSRITIVRKRFVEGSVEFSKDANNGAWKKWGVRYTRKVILATYAGPAVSIKLEPGLDLFEEGGWYEFDMTGAHDFCHWISDTSFLYDETDKKTILDTKNWKKAVSLVEQNWPAIKSVADELLSRQTMSGHEVKVMLNAPTNAPGRPSAPLSGGTAIRLLSTPNLAYCDQIAHYSDQLS